MIVSKTPLRISFFGGGTDYPEWSKDHPGAVLSTTIDKYTYLSVRWLPPFFEHKYRVVWSRIENVNSLDEIYHPIVRECLKHLKVEQGVAINHDADLPARSGMGTSSAFTVGLLNALHNLRGDSITSAALANEAIELEQRISRVGNQDQMAATHGGLNIFRFGSTGTPMVEPVALDNRVQAEFHKRLLLVFTGFFRDASQISRTYKLNQDQELTRMYELVAEGLSALKSQHWQTFGLLLDEAWRIKRLLSPVITSPYIDYLYQKAKDAGATGGKLLGAGAGGFLLLFCEPEQQVAVREALKGLLFVPFELEKQGTRLFVNHD